MLKETFLQIRRDVGQKGLDAQLVGRNGQWERPSPSPSDDALDAVQVQVAGQGRQFSEHLGDAAEERGRAAQRNHHADERELKDEGL